MNLTVQFFGITRDIIGASHSVFYLPENTTVQDLLAYLRAEYPPLLGLKSVLVAVNNEYAEGEKHLTASDEIALIPPVSGG